VTVATRLLMAAHGSGGFRTQRIVTITAARQGGWTVMSQATAAAYNGHVYVVYVNGANGNVEIVDYDEAAGTTSAAFVLHAAIDSPADGHDGPSVLIRSSDHRIVVAYSQHGDTAPRVRISTNPADISAFGSEAVLSVGQSSVTYCNLFELTSEGAIYLFYRDFDHGTNTSRLAYTKSTDGGSTWASQTLVYANPGESAYWHLGSNNVDRIDIAPTDKAPQAVGGSNASNVYHAYLVGGVWHQTDGTTIGASMPFAPADLTEVCVGSTMGGGNFPNGIAYTDDGRPVIADSLYLAGGTDNAYYDLRWSGSAWVVNVVAASAGGVYFSNQAPAVNVDPANANSYYAGVKVGATWEMFGQTTADDGATWTTRQLTVASTGVNWHPSQVVGHSATGVAMVWQIGTIVSDTDFSLGILGVTI
jgi:hypothetical protein